MKDFITGIGSILILMIFVVQFVTNQITYTKIAGAENAANVFQHMCESYGEVREEYIRKTRESIATIVKCTSENIEFTVVGNDEKNCEYKIRFPVDGVIGTATMLGIDNEDNMIYHQIEGTICLNPIGEGQDNEDGEIENEEYDYNYSLGDADDHAG